MSIIAIREGNVVSETDEFLNEFSTDSALSILRIVEISTKKLVSF